MNKTYNITDEKFIEAMNLIRENGGVIYADDSFVVSGVEGYFVKVEGSIEIVIRSKPFLASWGMIEDKLDSFFN